MKEKEEMTVDELLDAIRVEKQALIKAGKLKAEKTLPPIKPEEIPFSIPTTWKWVRLGEVCINIQYGTSKPSSVEGKIIVLRMGNIQDGRVVYDNLVYSSDTHDMQQYRLEHNDLLFNRTNSKDLVGKVGIYKGEFPAIYAGYLVRLTPLYVCADYLNLVMQTYYYWKYCQSVKSDAVSQSNINAEKIKLFPVPLPPLGEQRAIAERLEKQLADVEAMEAHFQTMADSAQQTFKSTLAETFDALTAPKVKLGELTECLDAKRRPITKCDRTYGQIPYYGATGVQDYINSYIFDEPLLLLGEDGAKWGAGDSSAYLIDGKTWVNNHAHVLRMKPDIIREYLMYYLNATDLMHWVSGMTVKKLNQANMREIPAPLPSLAEQEAIAGRLTEMQGRCEEMERLAREGQAWCKTLRKALLEEAFRN